VIAAPRPRLHTDEHLPVLRVRGLVADVEDHGHATVLDVGDRITFDHKNWSLGTRGIHISIQPPEGKPVGLKVTITIEGEADGIDFKFGATHYAHDDAASHTQELTNGVDKLTRDLGVVLSALSRSSRLP
jgi:hypothetical protein